jgi:hypothetical protein
VKRTISTVKGIMGLDFHVFSTVMLRGWGIGAGFLTTLLLPLLLSAPELGYYFAFASILGLQVFFELGFNQVITQLAGHEAAELAVDEDGSLNGASIHLIRLGALSGLTRRWYLIAAAAFVLGVGPAGLVFFGRNHALSPQVWALPWLALVLVTGINLYLSPRLAFLEGCGRIGNVARMRLYQSLFGYGCAWITLAVGGGIWSAVCVPLAACIFTAGWLHRNRGFGKRFTMPSRPASVMSWRRDILPLQWRISLSWISGYFIFSLFTPLIFSTAGAVAAGRFGLSMAIFTGLSTVSMSWMYAKVPEFARHASRGDLNALRRQFRPAAIRAVGVTIALCLLFVILAQIVVRLRPEAATRLLGPTDLSLLAIAVIANAVISSAATYMRSFREEPMLPVSIGAAILTSVAVYVGSDVSVTVMLALYAGITAGITLPWTIWIFRRYSAQQRMRRAGTRGIAP